MKQKTTNMVKEIKTMMGQKLTPRHLAQIARVTKVLLLFITGMLIGGLIESGFNFSMIAGVIGAIIGVILSRAAEHAFLEDAQTT